MKYYIVVWYIHSLHSLHSLLYLLYLLYLTRFHCASKCLERPRLPQRLLRPLHLPQAPNVRPQYDAAEPRRHHAPALPPLPDVSIAPIGGCAVVH